MRSFQCSSRLQHSEVESLGIVVVLSSLAFEKKMLRCGGNFGLCASLLAFLFASSSATLCNDSQLGFIRFLQPTALPTALEPRNIKVHRHDQPSRILHTSAMCMSDDCVRESRRSFVDKLAAGALLPLLSPLPAFSESVDVFVEDEVDPARSLAMYDAKQLLSEIFGFINMRPDAPRAKEERMTAASGADLDKTAVATLLKELMLQPSTTAPAKAAPPAGEPWFVQDITDRVTEIIRRYPVLAASARTGSQGQTSLLHWAAREGLLEACRLLVEGGASPTAACDSEHGGKNAIDLARANTGSGGINSGSSQEDVVRLLEARSRASRVTPRARRTQVWFDKS